MRSGWSDGSSVAARGTMYPKVAGATKRRRKRGRDVAPGRIIATRLAVPLATLWLRDSAGRPVCSVPLDTALMLLTKIGVSFSTGGFGSWSSESDRNHAGGMLKDPNDVWHGGAWQAGVAPLLHGIPSSPSRSMRGLFPGFPLRGSSGSISIRGIEGEGKRGTGYD